MNREFIAEQFKVLQDHICKRLEEVDGKSVFIEDLWKRDEGGGGRTRIIKDGTILEKGGVAFSEVHGPVSEIMRKQLGLDGESFFATGVSIVLHPNSPFVPIIHMNVRYFEMNTGVYWFGGGIDLTPHYIKPNQAAWFHTDLKNVCDSYNSTFYERFKSWADDYFYLPHRDETRGVGGLFFDHLTAEDCHLTKEQLLDFCLDLGRLFPETYEKQVLAGKDLEVKPDQLNWRNLRRGRYVEFNLVHDRGTKFGLLSGGRTESILMSLPKDASWEYGFTPEVDSPEAFTLNNLKKGIDWLNA
jgi:coproporphyrinogen III oxidase